jgi:glycosyltransferase involved in cell wall biosynthesis
MPVQKILYFCNYFQPMNYGENAISQALQAQGHIVKIVTGDKYFPFPDYQDTVEKLLGPRQQKVGESLAKGVPVSRHKIWLEFAARALFFGVKSSITEFQPDVILVSGLSTPVAVQAALFKPKAARLIFIDSHLPSELTQGNQFFKQIFYGVFRTCFAPLISQKADKIIAAQEATVEVITQTYGVTHSVTVISHGTDAELFRFKAASRKQVRQQLAIPANAYVIISTGKIIPTKGVSLLFEAISQLLPQFPELHLLIVGDGPAAYLAECWGWIPKAYRKNIHLVGFQPQECLPAYYAAADVAVWPLQESLAMNDALSCGLPIIVNDQVGVKERLSNHNALTYHLGEVADLTSKIEYLLTHPTERRAMGQRGRELVEKKMTWQQKAQAYLE